MKKLITTSILAVLVAATTTVMAQDYPEEYLGLPGDNLNLYAVMKLFQESPTLEAFERSLNDENSRINNLDLNNDGKVDYIDVIDYVDGDVHSIVLRALLGPQESQDVAVFTVQKSRDGSVHVQLVGDDELYGKDYIIEPYYDENTGETINPGYVGRPSARVNVTIIRTTPFEIAGWPIIRFIYMPDYVVWRSRWYWGYYPPYWHPWRPLFWHYYYGYHYNWYHTYYAHYRHWNSFRYPRYNDFYYHSVRAFSPQVNINIRDGRYRTTYSHPEQRKEGEALYSRTYHGTGTGRSDGRIDDNRRRDNVSQAGRGHNNEAAGNNRQSERVMNSRTSTDVNRTSRPEVSGRKSQDSNDQRVQRSSEDNKSVINRNQNETMKENNNRRYTESKNQEVSRRTSPSVSERPAARAEQRQKEVSVRTQRSGQKSERAAVNRSSRESKAGNAESKSSKSEKSERSSGKRR